MISIIVPAYNCQDYLDRCVRSILAQTYQDLELILVNDGSEDATPALCDAWAERDNRVRVIHQQNGGVSAARNAGLSAARGEYIGFVDADDWIDANTYRVAVEELRECDMVMWDAKTVWADGRTEPDTIDLLAASQTLAKDAWEPALLRLMAGAVWRCLYRTELISDIRFPVGIKLSEDRLFNLQAMGKATSLRYIKQELYMRYVHPESAVHRYHPDLMEKNLKACELAMQIIDQYWSADYRPVYTRMFLTEGALAMIRQICSRAYPGNNRRKAIRAVVTIPQVQKAFAVCAAVGLQEKLLHRKAVLGLWVIGTIYRVK